MDSQLFINTIKNNYKQYSFIYKTIAFLFSLVYIVASIEVYLPHPLTVIFHELFIVGLLDPRFLSILQLLFLLLMGVSLVYFRIDQNETSIAQRLFFWYIVLCYALNMINPNNNTRNPILGMPLLSNFDEYLLIILVFFYTFWSPKSFLNFIFLMFKFLTISLILRAIFLFYMWAMGNGAQGFFGINATITESDSLFIYTFFQLIFLGLYLLLHKKKFLIISIFFFVFILLSYRRTYAFISLLGSITIILFYIYIIKRSFSIIISLILMVLFIIPLSGYLQKLDLDTNNKFVKRMLSALPNSRYNTKSLEYSDSGHWEQTFNTTKYFFEDNIHFFGTGYGNTREGVVRGQSVTIHNVFIATWAYVGFHLFLLIMFLFFYVIRKLIRYTIQIRALPREFNVTSDFGLLFVKLFILIIFFYYFIGLLFVSIPFFHSFKMQFMWVSFFYLIFKIDEFDWSNYFREQSN
ncbi:MAG: hypothetical protein JXJ22_17085 [Bacteroidales bacterium]|nr:hypothetical protein [Bacteroidales bacterium]